MNNNFNHFKDYLASLLNEEEAGHLTRRLMDLAVDFNLPENEMSRILELRKKYNLIQYKAIPSENLTPHVKVVIEDWMKNFGERTSTAPIASPAIAAEEISHSYKGRKFSFQFKSFNFKTNIGEIVGVVGENGNGKTTLLNMLSGRLESDTGSIHYPILGEAVNQSWYNIKQNIGYISQRIPRFFGSLEQELSLSASTVGILGEENIKAVEFIIQRLGLEVFRDRSWSQLSGGYKLRFELARILIRKPKLLILDEPLANLDINAQQLFLQDLKMFAASHSNPVSIIISSQQLHEIENISDQLIFIKNGEVLYSGARNQFGSEREYNSIEISGNFNKADLSIAFPEYQIEDFGTIYIISIPKNMNANDFITAVIQKGFQIGYFRDISTSTRQLFRKDM